MVVDTTGPSSSSMGTNITASDTNTVAPTNRRFSLSSTKQILSSIQKL
jgi:hypothetical protein